MLIERHLFNTFPTLRPSQFLSLQKLVQEAAEVNKNAEIRRLIPQHVLNSTLALNGAYALFLDDLYKGATEYSAVYRAEKTFRLSEKMWIHWQQRSANLTPGTEYQIVDEFADMLELRDWYVWQPDCGSHEVNDDPIKEGTTNPELLKEKQPAVIFYFLDAFKRYDAMTPNRVRDVAFEIALLGRSGFDYSDVDQKYVLKSLPESKFSGLHLMCLMYAGFKRVAPEQDLGMDLNDPFLTALQLYKKQVS